MDEEFDVFLIYHSADALAARHLANELRRCDVRVFMEGSETAFVQLEKAILSTRTAVVLVGSHGVGSWQKLQIKACLVESIRRPMPVIPVLLPGSDASELSVLLGPHRALDLTEGIDDEERTSYVVRSIIDAGA